MAINLNSREQEILQVLIDDSSTSVSQFSKILGVSEVTVRSDMKTLANKGFIVRTHGGAVPAFHPSILDRQKTMVDQKESIARFAATLIKDGDNVMISAGTTPSLIMKYLLGRTNTQIVTNSTYLLPYARINPGIQVTFVGGEFKPSAEAIIGPVAARHLSKLRVHTAFVGTDGFSVEGGVSAHSMELADIVRKMSLQADQTVLVTDSSKFGKTGFAHILDIDEIDVLVTDEKLDPTSKAELEEKGLTVELT